MEWRQDIPVPAEDKDAEPGNITFFRLHADLLLMLIDIRSYKIPEILSKETRRRTENAFYINCCTEGRCELFMKDGSATFLECGELAVDMGHTVHDNVSYYYPNQVYRGVELCLVPGEDLDRALSMGADTAAVTTGLQRLYLEQNRLLIIRPEDRICTALEILAEDAALGMPGDILRMDVCRLFVLLGKLQFTEISRRTWYTDSQVQIAKLAMKELSEHLDRRIPAAELAAKYGISESSLKNYFRGVYGRGYHRYLNELRMKKAAELLTRGGIRVSEVAAAVGYGSQSRFAKAFREYFGIPPAEYSRRAHIRAEGEQGK